MTDREIRFRRNPDYYDPYAVLVEAYEVKFRDSPDAIWEDFKTGSLDLFEIPPNLLAEYDQFLQSAPYQEQANKDWPSNDSIILREAIVISDGMKRVLFLRAERCAKL